MLGCAYAAELLSPAAAQTLLDKLRRQPLLVADALAADMSGSNNKVGFLAAHLAGPLELAATCLATLSRTVLPLLNSQVQAPNPGMMTRLTAASSAASPLR